MVGLLAGFLFGSGYLIWLYRYLRSYIILSEDSISQVLPNRLVVSIMWGDITGIKRHMFNQRAEIISTKVHKKIKIEYQIDKFLELQDIINGRTPHLQKDLDTFHVASYPVLLISVLLISGIGLTLSMVLGLIDLFTYDSGLVTFYVLCGLVGVLLLPWTYMRSVTIGRNTVLIRYPLRTKIIPVKDISSVEQSQVTEEEGVRFNVVVLNLKSGKSVAINNVKEGDDLLYGKLKAVVNRPM